MPYQPKNFDNLLGMSGFSDQMLKNHFALYQGYVTNTNKLSDAMREFTVAGKAGMSEWAELKRRFGWEFNGMRLHELYFGNMKNGESRLNADSALYKKISADFGAYEAWEKEFKATGAMRGIGWTILYYDSELDRLFNIWINEHDLGHLAGCRPLLVLDVFEHAYMLDYGLKRADYVEAFFKAIDWGAVDRRFE